MGPPASKTRRFDRLVFNSALLSTCQVSGKIFAPTVALEMSNISVVCEKGNLAIGPNGAIEQRKYIWLPECVFFPYVCVIISNDDDTIARTIMFYVTISGRNRTCVTCIRSP